MKYGSVCSGIEAATQAWHPMGWTPAFFSEIAERPREVLAHRHPDTPLHGDFTTIKRGDYDPIRLLVGGTPCQSFSIAGLRGGVDDERGNLALEYLKLAERLGPEWLVWENVPGVLSSISHTAPDPREPSNNLDAATGQELVIEDIYNAEELHAFQCFLSGLREIGYGFAYRILDAQYIRVDGFLRAVPQRRRRVILVGYTGDWRPAAAVLFDRHSLQGHPAPRREAGQDAAGTLSARTRGGGGLGTDFECNGGLAASIPGDIASTDEVDLIAARKLSHGEFVIDGTASTVSARDFKGATDLIAFSSKDYGADAADNVSATLRAGGHRTSHANAGIPPAVAIQERAASANPSAGPDGVGVSEDGAAYTLEARSSVQAVAYDLRGRKDGAQMEWPHDTANIRAASGGSSRSYIVDGVAGSLTAGMSASASRMPNEQGALIPSRWAVRRLTTIECARLQGFPDTHAAVPTPRERAVTQDMARYLESHGLPVWRHKGGHLVTNIMADGPQYMMYGNSMAVNKMRWIGRRIQLVEDILKRVAA